MKSEGYWNEKARRLIAISSIAAVATLVACNAGELSRPLTPQPLSGRPHKAAFAVVQSCYYDGVFGWNCNVQDQVAQIWTVYVDIGSRGESTNGVVYADCRWCDGYSPPTTGYTGVQVGQPDDKPLADSLALEKSPECYEVPGKSTPVGSSGSFDTAKFKAAIDSSARSGPAHLCAKLVRNALCAAGITGTCNDWQHPYCAKDYGPFLTGFGFTQTWSGSGLSRDGYPSGYSPQVGDIVVFTYDPSGHVAGFDGNQWVSDYKQPDIQPDATNGLASRAYTIYRRP